MKLFLFLIVLAIVGCDANKNTQSSQNHELPLSLVGSSSGSQLMNENDDSEKHIGTREALLVKDSNFPEPLVMTGK